ncbi:AAA family ATPase [Paucibacter sp. B2R-40]|uniref:AAA family ATPase n=1 Tax=Paucibacter sp. B2R-40 TaxID=2893554 RepID=UPI0021E428E9|nr:AAA family ATPase [Paucibacter sp. B2R-40]MCV2355275.1 AAA family ATPase [Paucibacter sp. B2R-40]
MTALTAHAVALDRLDLRLLGRPRVLRPGLPDHLLERRDAALLVFLALSGAASRKQMAQALWPDVSERMALTNLRQRLFRFKRRLAADVFAEGEMLALRPGLRHDLDVGAEPQLLSEEAVPLGGLNYLDCEPLAERVEQMQQQWLKQRRSWAAQQAEALEAQGHLAQALIWAQHLTLHEPSSEHAHRRLMRLHYRRGDRTAALAAYRACRQRLLQDLGVTPGAETRALAEMIERSEASAPALQAASASPAATPVLQPLPAGVAAGSAPPRQTVSAAPQARPVALPPALAAALWRPPRLIGREAEWQALASAAQRGQLLLVRGEAGMGKTRLAQDFCASAGPGLVIKASAADAATPYAFLARWLQGLWELLGPAAGDLPGWALAELARILPAFGEAAAAPLQPQRLQGACSALLQACQGAATQWLLLDDVQWIDLASLECLLPVLASPALQVGPAAALCVLTARNDEDLPAPLAQWLAREPDGLFELTLGPLTEVAAAAFVLSLDLPMAALGAQEGRPVAMAPDCEQLANLQRLTGGRPLFMLEILRGAAGQLAQAVAGQTTLAPPLQALIAKRLAVLSAPALRLLRVAALLGPRFRLDWVAAVLGQHPVDLVDAWAELQAAQFMSEDGFAFDLAAEVAAASVPQALACLLHAAIAPVLQAGGSAAAVVAMHWQLAQAWAYAAEQWLAAAQQARQASRRVEELSFMARAEACLQRQQAPQPQLFEVACLALQAAMVAEPPEKVHGRLAALLTQAQGDNQRLRALLLCGRYEAVVSGLGGLDIGVEALALARSLGDRASEALAVAWLGIALVFAQRAEEGLGLFEGLKDWVLAQPEARLKLDFFGAYGYVLHGCARYQQALAPLAQAAALAEGMGDLSEAADHLGNLAVCQQLLGQGEASLPIYERIKSVWERMGQPGGAGNAGNLLHVASSLFLRGRFAEALELLDWCLKEFRQGQAPVWTVIAENRLAQAYLRLGQWARARQVMTALPDGLRVGNRIARLCLECRLDALNRQDVLPRLLQAQAAWDGDTVDLMDRCILELNILRYESAVAALVRCDRLQALVPAELLSVRLSLGAWRADALRRLGRGQEAAGQAEQVLRWIEQAKPVELELVELCWLAAQALAASKAYEPAAQQALAQARDWIEQAKPFVPPAFLPSFLESNPHNRQVLAGQG